MDSVKVKFLLIAACALIVFTGCAQPTRLGMIKDPATGIQYGSVIEKSFFIDASQFENNSMKLSARNVSGDYNYNIRDLVRHLRTSFSEKGYSFGDSEEFGIKFDVIVEYSGHIQKNMAAQYGFLGGLTGGVVGYRSEARAGEAIGVLAGATLGAIAGSYVTEDTYIIIAKVSIGVINRLKSQKKTVTFSTSPELQNEKEVLGVNYFRDVKSTKIAVFAGGQNVNQSDVVQAVKNRLYSIIADII
ncbi:complement resistance protein TraT [Desulfobacula sp.]|uniref:complement resistance protein TraT n=1 Tax=Desulfobacula sp. TaxID=2593537 RepID=UPI001EC243AA|nr:hypothetical protein [Desulfobacula sp.]